MAATVWVNGSPTTEVYVPLNSTVVLLNGTLTGVLSQTWEILSYPEYEDLTQIDYGTNYAGWTLASGVLSIAQVTTFPGVSFKGDIPGTYLLRLSATTGSGTLRQTCVVRIRSALTGDAEPAAGENIESGSARGTGGWARLVNRWMRNAEIRKGRVRIYNGTGVTIAINKVGKLSGLIDFRTVAGNTVPSGTATRAEKVPSIVVGNSNDADALTAKYVVLTEAIANDSYGWGVAWGQFEGNFSGFGAGGNAYLNTTGDLVSAPAGTNTVILGYVLSNAAAGGIFFNGMGGGGGAATGAPSTPQFMTLAADAGLANERVFTPSAAFTVADGGAGAAYTITIATAGVTRAMLANGAATSVVGRAAGTTGAVADITATLDGQFLKRSGGSLVWAAILDAELPATLMRTSWTLTAGAGLAGGGDGSANRSISIATAGVTSAMLRDSIACSVIGRAINSTGVTADIQAASSGQYLSRQGTSLVFAAILDADLPGTIVRTSRQVIAGAGLTGTGTLASDVTISMPSVVTPGAYGGGGIASLTIDAQGRVTALSTATYGTSTTVIAAGRIAWATSTNVVGGSANLTWDDTLKLMTFANGRIDGLTATNSTYVADGLFSANARHALKWGTPNGSVFGRLGYDDGGGGQYQPAIGLDVSGAGRAAIRFRVVGEANDKFTVINDGTFQWGPGGATVVDTTFGRSAAGTLTQSQGTHALVYAAGSGAILHNYNGEVQPRWQIHRDAMGGGLAGIAFGPGGATTLAAAGAGVGFIGTGILGVYLSNGSSLVEGARFFAAGGFALPASSAAVPAGTAAFRYNANKAQFAQNGSGWKNLDAWETATVTAGSGLSGGGSLLSNPALAIAAAGVTSGMLRDSIASSVIGRALGSTGPVADIQASASGQYLSRQGTALVFAAILDADLPATIVRTSAISIASGQVAFATAANVIGGTNNLFWDNPNARLGLGTNTPGTRLHVVGEGRFANGNTSAGSAQDQITLGFTDSNYRHTIKSRHNAGQVSGNGIDIFLWTSVDALGTTGTTKVATFENSAFTVFSGSSTTVNAPAGGTVTHTYNGEANPRWAIGRDAVGGGLAGITFGLGGASAIATVGAAVGLVTNSTLGLYVGNGSALAVAATARFVGSLYQLQFPQTNSQIKFEAGAVGPPAASINNHKIILYADAVATQNYSLGVEGSNLWYNSNGGHKFYSTGTNVATIDNLGRTTFGSATAPRYFVDVTGVNGSQIHFATGTGDFGGYLISTSSDQAILCGGAAWNGANWVAKSTSQSSIQLGSASITLTCNAGLTVGAGFAPQNVATFDTVGGVAKMSMTANPSYITFGANALGVPSAGFFNYKVIVNDSGSASTSAGMGAQTSYLWLNGGNTATIGASGLKFYVGGNASANVESFLDLVGTKSGQRLYFPQATSRVDFGQGSVFSPLSGYQGYKVLAYDSGSSSTSFGMGMEFDALFLSSGQDYKFYAGGNRIALITQLGALRLMGPSGSALNYGPTALGASIAMAPVNTQPVGATMSAGVIVTYNSFGRFAYRDSNNVYYVGWGV